MRPVVLLLRFGCELALLAALAYWGASVADGILPSVALGITAPTLAAVAWGLFLSPKRRFQLPVLARTALELTLFGTAIAALFAIGQPVWRLCSPSQW